MELEVGAKTGAAYGEKECVPACAAQRLPRSGLGNASRGRWNCAFPSSARSLFPRFLEPRRMAGEGSDRSHPAQTQSVCREEAYIQGVSTRSVDDLSANEVLSRPSKHGHERHLQEPGLPAVRPFGNASIAWRARGDRRQGEGIPCPPDRGRLALSVDRRHLHVGPAWRPHRLGRRQYRRRRQYRWDGAKSWAWKSARQRPSRSGRNSLLKLTRRSLRGVKLVVSDAHEGIKAAVSKVLFLHMAALPGPLYAQCLGSAGKERGDAPCRLSSPPPSRRDTQQAASQQWRSVADQIRPKVPKLATLMDNAEEDVPAYMTFFQAALGKASLDKSDRTPQRRDQAQGRRRRHLSNDDCHRQACRRTAARAKRRVGCSAIPLHDT